MTTKLTENQKKVLELVGQGASISEVAEELFLSISSAKRHIGALFEKTGARDRVQLVLVAHNLPILFPKEKKEN